MFATEAATPVPVLAGVRASRGPAPPRAPAPGGVDLGSLAERVRPTSASRSRLLPVPAPLVPLLPDGGLRRGSVVLCSGVEDLSLVLALIGRASGAGSWCGLAGVDDLWLPAATGHVAAA